MEKIFNVTANVFVVPNSLQFNKKTGEVTCASSGSRQMRMMTTTRRTTSPAMA